MHVTAQRGGQANPVDSTCQELYRSVSSIWNAVDFRLLDMKNGGWKAMAQKYDRSLLETIAIFSK